MAAPLGAARDQRRKQPAEAAHQPLVLVLALALAFLGLERLDRRGGARDTEPPRDRGPDRRRLGQAARAVFAAGHRPLVGLDHLDPGLAQPCHVAPRRRVPPHAHVHRRDRHDRLVGREEQRGREVVGDARRHLGEQVRGRRAHDHQVGLAAEPDMAHLGLVLEIPQRGIDRVLAQRGERHRGDELLPALGHHASHRTARLADQPDELARLVRRDAAADHEQDAQAFTGHRRSSRCHRARLAARASPCHPGSRW